MSLLGSWMVWAVTFIPMPMPKTVCRTTSCKNMLHLEVCVFLSGRDLGMNITAHGCSSSTHVCRLAWVDDDDDDDDDNFNSNVGHPTSSHNHTSTN